MADQKKHSEQEDGLPPSRAISKDDESNNIKAAPSQKSPSTQRRPSWSLVEEFSLLVLN